MKRGQKLSNPDRKKISGTFANHRDAATVTLALVPSNKPNAPDWLSDGAKDVWTTDIDRAAKMGLAEIDQSAFALYCETMAAFIASIKNNVVPNAAFRSELRKQLELLGMAGAKSRLAKVGTQDTAKASPFTVRK